MSDTQVIKFLLFLAEYHPNIFNIYRYDDAARQQYEQIYERWKSLNT